MTTLRLKTLFLLFTIGLFFWACEKDDDDPNYGTDYGAQYFKCDLNGVPFKTDATFNCSSLLFHYYPESYLGLPAGYCVIGGKNCPERESVILRIDGLADTTGYLDFSRPAIADSCYPYYNIHREDLMESFLYEKLIGGHMNIEHFIPRQDNNAPFGSIKGTFEFTVTDELGLDTMRITNGRFRFDVPQIF